MSTSSPRSTFVLVLSALALLVVALSFNALLTISSLEELYIDALASKYQVFGRELQRTLEKGLRFGKPIRKFVGMEQILESSKRSILEKVQSADLSISIARPGGLILYSTNESLVGTEVPFDIDRIYGGRGASSGYVKDRGAYFVALPLHDALRKRVADIIIGFDEAQVNALLDRMIARNARLIAVIVACGALLLPVLIRWGTSRKPADGRLPKRKVSIIIFLLVVSAQVVFSAINIDTFRTYYLGITREKVQSLATLLKEDIERLLDKGLELESLRKMEAELQRILDSSPELRSLSIERPFYIATRQGSLDFQGLRARDLDPGQGGDEALRILDVYESVYGLRVRLVKDGKIEGTISASISQDHISGWLHEILLDSLTVLAISILFLVELMILALAFVGRKAYRRFPQALGGECTEVDYGTIRPAAFLFIFGIDISVTFLPLHMENLYEPLFNLSRDMVMGLPISMEMLFTALAIVLAGGWIDRRGWHEPFLVGLMAALGGCLYSWLAPNAVQFILSRGLVGLGYGFCAIAAQGFIVSTCDSSTRAQGLAQLFAGIYAGSICGGAAGAMLAERIGYGPVFLAGAFVVFLTLLYTFGFMRGAFKKPEYVAGEMQHHKGSMGLRQALGFILNRNILVLLLFISLPSAVAFKGFFNYFSPIYLSRIGESQSNIGRIFMIYGICLIYIAPLVSKYIDASESKKRYVFLSGLLGSLAFLSFLSVGGLLATALAILLLGLSESFDASRPYALKLRVTRELGPGRSLGLYASMSRMGQVIGPLIFGWLILTADIEKAVTYFGFFYLGCAILFALFSRSDARSEEARSYLTG